MEALTGKVLVAMPNIGDPRFARSVILICAHNQEFAMGVMLNKPLDDLKLPDLLDQLDIVQDIEVAETYVLNGGPVSTDRGFVVHTPDYFNDGATMEVSDGLCMTATHDVLRAMASRQAPARAAMALGYAGWNGGQIEHELAQNAWLIGEPDSEVVFGTEHAQKWETTLRRMGINSAFLLADSGRA